MVRIANDGLQRDVVLKIRTMSWIDRARASIQHLRAYERVAKAGDVVFEVDEQQKLDGLAFTSQGDTLMNTLDAFARRQK